MKKILVKLICTVAVLFIVCLPLVTFITSCGGSGGGYGSSPPPTTTQPEDKAWTDSVGALVKKDCGTCHGVKAGIPAFATGAAFKASKAKGRLTAGTMPPAPATISDADKQAMLAYLGS